MNRGGYSLVSVLTVWIIIKPTKIDESGDEALEHTHNELE